MLVEQINASGGILGARVELDIRDESGGPDKMVTLYRQLVEQEGVDAYIGLISSADCLAVAPVAEELGRVLTVFFDCATVQLVDNKMMKRVVFRPAGTTVTDGVALARYVVETMPDIKTVAGLNQDYAYGHDEWNDFKAALLDLKPDVQIVGEFFTPLFTSDYSAQISKIMSLKPDLLHTSFWGPDLVNLIKQGSAMGLFNSVKVAFARGEFGLGYGMPDGQLVEGPNYHAFPNPRFYWINKDFIQKYQASFGEVPTYPAYHMANAVLAVKYAYEVAAAVENVGWPDLNAVVKVLENLAYPTPGGYVVMTPTHNAMCGAVVGQSKGGKLANLRYYVPEETNPPPGVTSADWLKGIA
ncbi:putative substrate-binding component of ABC transporter [Thermoproteus uzoniensis 768-20]|uniref:Substrate-binding component of ABC transporter n=2 Tax=Thermoproteus TaxID=2270 RepID=F2L0J7_THEU7|nr:putative substrate-binding component of ABC transporter [Thermoproteus uzoniensis 768-20]